MDTQTVNNQITKEELDRAVTITNRINSYYHSKVVGQPWLGFSLMAALVANGHVLLESVPGLAKTTAAKVMTEAVNGAF